ncbi:MAG: ribosomal protein S18-alanine N-acetyltransferase [Terriglobia bacterium]
MVVIRAMQEEDLSEIIALENSWDFLSKWGKQGYLAAINNPFMYFCFVAEDSELTNAENASRPLTGLAVLAQMVDHSEICNIIVAPAFLSKGVGQELLNTCLDLSEKLRFPRVLLEVRQSNERAIRFYKKNGFQKIGERKDYYSDPRENAWVMERVIFQSSV